MFDVWWLSLITIHHHGIHLCFLSRQIDDVGFYWPWACCWWPGGEVTGKRRVYVGCIPVPLQPSNHVMIYVYLFQSVYTCTYVRHVCSFSSVFSLLLYFTSLSLFLSLNMESSYAKNCRLLQSHNHRCEVPSNHGVHVLDFTQNLNHFHQIVLMLNVKVIISACTWFLLESPLKEKNMLLNPRYGRPSQQQWWHIDITFPVGSPELNLHLLASWVGTTPQIIRSYGHTPTLSSTNRLRCSQVGSSKTVGFLAPFALRKAVNFLSHREAWMKKQAESPGGSRTRWWWFDMFFIRLYLGNRNWCSLTQMFQMDWKHQLDSR